MYKLNVINFNMIDFYRQDLYDFFLEDYDGTNADGDFDEWVYGLDEDDIREIVGEE